MSNNFSFNQAVNLGFNVTGTPSITNGAYFTLLSKTFTDSTTNASGTLSNWSSVSLNTSTLASSNTSVTTTTANTFYIAGAPTAGTNQTLTTRYALNINSGNTKLGGDLILAGSSSGLLSIKTQAAAGTFNFNMPTTAGTSGQVLTSAGGGSSPMTWTTITSGTVNLTSGITTTGTASLGNFFNVNAVTFTDNATATSGTLSSFYSTYIGIPTLAASNATVTTTKATTFYVAGPPTTGTNETITTKYALEVASGNTLLGGNLTVSGTSTNSNPYFIANKTNGDVSGISGGYAVLFNNVTIDSNGNYNAGNGRYTPSVAGVYSISMFGQCTGGGTINISIFLNGSFLVSNTQPPGGFNGCVSGIVNCNGSSDYITIVVSAAGSFIANTTGNNQVMIIKIR